MPDDVARTLRLHLRRIVAWTANDRNCRWWSQHEVMPQWPGRDVKVGIHEIPLSHSRSVRAISVTGCLLRQSANLQQPSMLPLQYVPRRARPPVSFPCHFLSLEKKSRQYLSLFRTFCLFLSLVLRTVIISPIGMVFARVDDPRIWSLICGLPSRRRAS